MSAPRASLGQRLARFLARPRYVHSTSAPADLQRLQASLRPGDVLLVEGHSLFVPRDFDVSPYFEVVKPTLAGGFDHRSLRWHEAGV